LFKKQFVLPLEEIMKNNLLISAIAGILSVGSVVSNAAEEQFVPIPIYRTGPYAAGGAAVFGGFMDYMAMLNARDGGINGVKLTWEECETAYKPDRGIECYERMKDHPPTGAAMFNFLNTPMTYAAMERTDKDKIPIVSIGYGRADSADGRVFPYVFPLATTYWNQTTTKLKFIGMKEGGMDKLKGKKIAHVYHDSGFGKETIPVLEALAKKHGFTVQHYPVAHPGLEQKAVWLQVRQQAPDWVILRGWGVMNPTALKESKRIGFPTDHIVGVWWSGSEEDVIPAGDAAKGFITAAFHPGGKEFGVIKDVEKFVYEKGNGAVDKKIIGSIYYNRGIIHGILNTEAIRSAQEHFGKKALTGEQVRWGLEHLTIDEATLKKLGAEGFLSTMKTTCEDHEGSGKVRFQQWDGAKWNSVSDWITPDYELTRPMVEASAMQYAKEKGVTPRDCSKEK